MQAVMSGTSNASQLLSEINASYVGRDSPTKQLIECLLQTSQTVIVYGLRSTAKTSVVKTLCQTSDSMTAYVNCNEFFINNDLYEHLLVDLNNKIKCFNDKEIVCNSLSDFIRDLKLILIHFNGIGRQLTKKTVFKQCILFLDSVDSNYQLLTSNNNELINSLANLEELTQNVCPITCVMISRQSIEWFRRITCYPLTAIQITFDNYSSEDLSAILSKDCPNNYDLRFYQNYINIIIRSVVHMTRDLNEIRWLCLTYFGEYVRPISDGQLVATDSAKLYKRFQPTLSRITDSLGLKQVDVNVALTNRWSDSSKYLLIACYLSSYNQTKNDKKLFVKYEGKRRERKRKLIQDKSCDGPKASTFERVLHIYKSIIELNAHNDNQDIKEPSNRLFSQFQELLSLKYINKKVSQNKSNHLSSLTKYQISSSVSFEFIKRLSDEMNFNIKAFIE